MNKAMGAGKDRLGCHPLGTRGSVYEESERMPNPSCRVLPASRAKRQPPTFSQPKDYEVRKPLHTLVVDYLYEHEFLEYREHELRIADKAVFWILLVLGVIAWALVPAFSDWAATDFIRP